MRNDTQRDLVMETLNLSYIFKYTQRERERETERQRESMSDVMDKIQNIFHELCLC